MTWLVRHYVDVHETLEGVIGKPADTFGPFDTETEADETAMVMTMQASSSEAFVVCRRPGEA